MIILFYLKITLIKLRPSQKEINKNNASRSAKLRFAIRNKKNFFILKV